MVKGASERGAKKKIYIYKKRDSNNPPARVIIDSRATKSDGVELQSPACASLNATDNELPPLERE